MRLDQRRLTFLSFRLLMPTMDRFSNELAEFLPRAREHFPFEHWHMDGDSGGVVETEGQKRLEVNRESVYYQESVTEDITVVSRNVADLLALTFLHFEIPFFAVQNIRLRQRWPLNPDSGSAGSAMRDRALKLEPDHFAPLGQVQNVGLHLIGTVGDSPDDGEDDEDADSVSEDDGVASSFHWHLEVDPFQRTEDELFIQLTAYFARPMMNADDLTQAVETTYRFLDDNVGKFVTGFMP